MRETELLQFDDSLLEAIVPDLTHQINRAPHEDGLTHQDIKEAHEGLLDEYQTSLLPFWHSNPLSKFAEFNRKRAHPPLVLRSKPAGSLLYLILPTLDLFLALLNHETVVDVRPG